MTETMKEVSITQPLRKEPRALSDLLVSPLGDSLDVSAGEKVKTGTKPLQDEVLENRTITWVWVEATEGPFVDLRKGYVSAGALVSVDTPVESPEKYQPFPEQVEKESFAETCYLQAMLNQTNPAYLYALAWALSGDQWSETHVKTNDPAGVFRFPQEMWQSLLSEPEVADIQTDEIKFPDVQCVLAAFVAAKSANLLKSLITDRGLSAVDLFLAHLFADDKSFGSNATAKILQAEKDNKDQSCELVIKAIYQDNAVRTAFFKRNADIFKNDGSASVEQALKVCAAKLDSGFAEAVRLANKIEGDVFGNSIPANPSAPLPGGVSSEGQTGAGAGGGASGGTGSDAPTDTGQATVAGIAGGIDRRQFAHELEKPAIVKKLADMVKGEIGWNAPQDTKIVQLETAFNRAIARGHSLAQALWSTSEAGNRGYYQGGPNGTYSRPVTVAEFGDFKKDILPKVLAGSSKSEQLLGFIATGNASPPTSTKQYHSGTLGKDLQSGWPNHPESYFREGPFLCPFKRLQGGELIPLPYEPSSSVPTASSHTGEPAAHMDGDVEGDGPSGGKFNVKAGTPIAPQGDHHTVTLNNGQTVTVNKAVAEQFRGFFNDLIKLGAPVRTLGGFGVRPNNPSEHPIGFAVDWAQHSRNVVDPDVRKWIDHNRATLKKLELRWGLSGGENWSNPDTGHFSIERILGKQHLMASREASANA
jgi:hypothetical protein